jgi:hypothetical protein
VHITNTSCATLEGSPFLAILSDLMQYQTRLLITYDSTERDCEFEIVPICTVLIFGFARFAISGFVVMAEEIFLECVFVIITHEDHITTASAVASSRSSIGDFGFSAGSDDAITTFARVEIDFDGIIEFHRRSFAIERYI